MTYLRQLIMIIFAISVLLGLQYQYWFGENGYKDTQMLQHTIAEQQQDNDRLVQSNKILQADVNDLKTGLEAVEEHARVDLGLIKSGETFVQMSTATTPYEAATSPTATPAHKPVKR